MYTFTDSLDALGKESLAQKVKAQAAILEQVLDLLPLDTPSFLPQLAYDVLQQCSKALPDARLDTVSAMVIAEALMTVAGGRSFSDESSDDGDAPSAAAAVGSQPVASDPPVRGTVRAVASGITPFQAELPLGPVAGEVTPAQYEAWARSGRTPASGWTAYT